MSEDGGMSARHSSESTDHFTPPFLVEAARATLGAIDFDPFSNFSANMIVRATEFLDGTNGSGFLAPWKGRCLVNPPGSKCDSRGQPVVARTKHRGPCTETGDCGLPAPHSHDGNFSSQKLAWFKLMKECAARRVDAAIFICFSVELLQTSQVDNGGLLIPLDWPICYPSRRVQYVKPNGALGTSPPHASCIICVYPEIDMGGQGVIDLFKKEFSGIGKVVVPA